MSDIDDGHDKPIGFVSEDGCFEVRESVDKDGQLFRGYHETELGQHDRWLRQAPDLYEKYQALHTGAMTRLEALGRDGFVVSVCCGPCGDRPLSWSVQVLSRTGEDFERPFGALSFDHAVEIAESEISERGWR